MGVRAVVPVEAKLTLLSNSFYNLAPAYIRGRHRGTDREQDARRTLGPWSIDPLEGVE